MYSGWTGKHAWIVRPAREADVHEIGRLWLELIQYHRTLDDQMPMAAEDGPERYAERIRYGLNDSFFQVYVAVQNDDVIGYVFGTVIDLLPETFVGERTGIIGDIYVKAAYRGQGIGTALMQVMKDWFKLRGVSHYELTVAAANAGALRFWKEAMGAHPVVIRVRASVVDGP